jgi:hypothetical protein
LYHVDLFSSANPHQFARNAGDLNKNAAGDLRHEKVDETLSAYRRDSRKPLEDKATNADNERGFARAEGVDHVRDYN